MFNQFAFVQRMADEAASRHFAQIAEQKRAETARQIAQQEAAKLRQEEERKFQQAKAHAETVKKTIEQAIAGLEQGNLESVTAVFTVLNSEERELFLHVKPLEVALLHGQFIIAEYLVDMGERYEHWRDYVTDDSSSLTKKLMSATCASITIQP